MIQLYLTLEQLQAIIHGIRHLPHLHAQPLLDIIQQQVDQQVRAAEAAAAEQAPTAETGTETGT